MPTDRFTYSLLRVDGGYVARCDELSLEAEETSAERAVAALKRAIEQRLTSVEAVAPPSRPPTMPTIELVRLDPPAEGYASPGSRASATPR